MSTTSYFTFGQAHCHIINGILYNKDIVVKITGHNPRETMFSIFGRKWSMEYNDLPDMSLFPAGIVEIKED